MVQDPETAESTAEEGSPEPSNGVSAALIVGWIMVGIYLLSAALQAYETNLLNFLFLNTSQFAFLQVLFPSPAAEAVLAWQNIVLFEVVPFLLFFYLAVRMHISPLGRILPTVVAIAVVGACVFVVASLVTAFQPNISHLLLSGSFTLPSSSETLVAALSSILSPTGLLFVLANGVVFAALGMTGIAFGNFSGETPYWIVKSCLASEDYEEEDVESISGDPADIEK
jgi:hypothetical protein